MPLDQRRRRPHDPLRRAGQGPKHCCAFVQEIEFGVVERVAQGEDRLDVAFDRKVTGKEQSVAVEAPVREPQECSNWAGDTRIGPRPPRRPHDRHLRLSRIECDDENEWQIGRFEDKSLACVFAEPIEHRRMAAADRPDQMAQGKLDERKRDRP